MDGTVITKKGMQLLVKLIATKGVLEFTRVSVGTGVMQNGYDPASMTDLIQYKMDGMISECEADGDIAKITMQISSVGIETGFTMTEMGVFADDPDLGEILYAYLDMREDPQYIYAEGGTAQKFVEVTLDVAIEEATKVTTYINPKSMITRKEFEEVTGNVNVTEKGSLQNQIGRLEEKSESVQNQIDQIKNGDAPVIFEDYTSDELDIPDPEYAINQITSGKSSKLIQQYIKAALKGLLNLAQRALNIATGRNQARVFATVAALDAWLAVPDNVKQLNVGDNFYITATDVPDYWWDGIQKQKLETQKVDLTTYDQRITANASAISELNGNISSHNHDNRYYTETEVNNLLAGKSGTSHSHAWSAITGKPDTFTPSNHNHDGRYYTKTEVNNLLTSFITTKRYTYDNITIKAGETVNLSYNIDLAGYVPMGSVVNMIYNASSGGQFSSFVLPYLYNTNVDKYDVCLKNLHSADAKIGFQFVILYRKA